MNAPMTPSNRPQRLSGLNGALPTKYDPLYRTYSDISAAQIAVFEAFPQDLIKYAGTRRWQKEIAGIMVNGMAVSTAEADRSLLNGLAITAQRSPPDKTFSFTDNGVAYTLTSAQALALFDAVSGYIQACRSAEATLIAAINPTPPVQPTVTSRAQIDAAFAAIKVA